MLVRKDSLITKNDLITFGVGSISTLLFLPIPFNFAGGLVALGLFKSLKHSMFTQSERNHLLSLPKVLNAQIRSLNLIGVIITFITLEAMTAIVDHYLQVSNWFYPLHFLTAVPIWLLIYFINNCSKVKVMQAKADDDIQILDSLPGKVLIYSKIHLKDEHKEKLALIINSHVGSIEQDLYRKNIFTINHDYGKEGKYRKMEKESKERLEQILIDMNGKPKIINSYENEVEKIIEITSTINPKRMIREMQNIEHKLGLKKRKLTIDQDDGTYKFMIKKDEEKMYKLDEYIGNTKKDNKMQLPFIAGMNYKTGSVIVKDLLDVLHLLVAGKTGSGKSVTFKMIIESLMYYNQNVCFYMLDFAESALTKYIGFANTKYIESDFESVKSGIDELKEEMMHRMKIFRSNDCENIKEYNTLHPDQRIPYLIFAIDEANGFKEELEKEEFEAIKNIMKALLKRGRKYGIIILFAVQQTNDNDFCKSWRTQTTRLGHLLSDTIDCNNLTTNKEIAQMIPHLGKGEFYLIQEGQEVVKMKGCLSDKENNKLYSILKEVYCNEVVETTEEIIVKEKEEIV